MTIGQGIGGILGGALGFVASGFQPWGAMVGFTIGSAIGGMLDPPDTNTAGGPDNSKVDVTTVEEGDPVPDLLGLSKLSGNIIGYWNPRTEEVRAGKKGGKGGSSKKGASGGYKYYLTWAMVLCEGPVDEVLAIYIDNDVCVWKGNITRPESGSYETIVIEGVGTCRFYFGTSNQPNESVMDGYLDDSTLNPAYRYWCYAFFDDCCVGPQGRMPSVSFVLRKSPTIFGSDTLETYDMNPASMIHYILHDKLEIDSSVLDSTSFADSFSDLATERFGLSMLFDQQQSSLQYLESILNHIDAVLTFQSDGTFHLDLLRNDMATGDIPVITEDFMLEPMTFERGSWLTTINELKVQYPRRFFTDDEDTEELEFVLSISSIGECGTYQFSATGGVPPYTWSVSGANASIDQNGLLTKTGSGNCTVTCTDSTGQSVSA